MTDKSMSEIVLHAGGPTIKDAARIAARVRLALSGEGRVPHLVRWVVDARRRVTVVIETVDEALASPQDRKLDLELILHDCLSACGPTGLLTVNTVRSPDVPVLENRRLVRWAVALLPAVDRPRYAEEFRAELWELREGSRRHQWAYAVRVLFHAPLLRRELRRPVPVRERAR